MTRKSKIFYLVLGGIIGLVLLHFFGSIVPFFIIFFGIGWLIGDIIKKKLRNGGIISIGSTIDIQD